METNKIQNEINILSLKVKAKKYLYNFLREDISNSSINDLTIFFKCLIKKYDKNNIDTSIINNTIINQLNFLTYNNNIKDTKKINDFVRTIDNICNNEYNVLILDILTFFDYNIYYNNDLYNIIKKDLCEIKNISIDIANAISIIDENTNKI